MASSKRCKVWCRFQSKRSDGSVLKLRIQDLPTTRMDDFLQFLGKYFIKEEAFHKAAGVAQNEKAIEEYKNLLRNVYGISPPEIAICCIDNDSEDFEEILGVSTVQITSSKDTLEDLFNAFQIQPESEELKALFNILVVLSPMFPDALKKRFENYYDGRGIIINPDYRRLGIASEFVKQRRLLCKEFKVPMTCAWMTSVGSQRAAERDNWETVAEITAKDLGKLSGLDFGNSTPIFKLMIATEE